MSAKILRETENFALTINEDRKGRWSWWVKYKRRDGVPKAKRVREKDANYLRFECNRDDTFDAACVWDFGVGVFLRGAS